MSNLGLPRKRRYSWLPEQHPSAISTISSAASADHTAAQPAKPVKASKSSTTTSHHLESDARLKSTTLSTSTTTRGPPTHRSRTHKQSNGTASARTAKSLLQSPPSPTSDPVLRYLLESDSDENGVPVSGKKRTRTNGSRGRTSASDASSATLPLPPTDKAGDTSSGKAASGSTRSLLTYRLGHSAAGHSGMDEGYDQSWHIPLDSALNVLSNGHQLLPIEPTTESRAPSVDPNRPPPVPHGESASPAVKTLQPTTSGSARHTAKIGASVALKLPNLNPHLKYTSFPSYTPINSKAIGSSYLKSAQAYRGVPGRGIPSKPAQATAEVASLSAPEQVASPGASGEMQTLIIHPGSRYLRIGKAQDIYPKAVPHVIARLTATLNVTTDTTPQTGDVMEVDGPAENGTSSSTPHTVKDSAESEEAQNAVDAVWDMMDEELRQRLKDAKRRPVSNADYLVTSFNRKARPETISDHNDPYRVEWTDTTGRPDHFVGIHALRIPTIRSTAVQPSAPHDSSDTLTAAGAKDYALRWPIQHGEFNTLDYSSLNAVLGDLATIWTESIETELQIPRQEFGRWSVVLVVPDLYQPNQVEALVQLVLNHLQFRRVLLQQESVCVTFGAGISSACVVDVGAQQTSVVCVEDGYCLPTTRVSVKYGGDDITRAFTELLRRRHFPYAEVDLNRTYDWQLMDGLKEKYCSLNESDVTVQVYDFVVRVPQQEARKFQLKVYDEPFLASMALFYPRLIPLLYPVAFPSQKLIGSTSPSVLSANNFTIDGGSTHLHTFGLTRFGKVPMVLVPVEPVSETLSSANGDVQPNTSGRPEGSVNGSTAPTNDAAEPAAAPESVRSTPGPQGGPVSTANTPAATPLLAPVDDRPKAGEAAPTDSISQEPQWVSYPDDRAPYSLLPLDQAITHCISHAGPEERCKRYYGNIVLVGGGCALTPGFAPFLERRLMLMRPPHLQGIEKIQVAPSPRNMDPRVLSWKGGSVLCKLDIANELWITPGEWRELGTKCFRDRLLFIW
ncbi:actin-like protein arp8 [Dimargaris verticillata]|uniref:Actin-like protein arp8 n=1 Tax=Dimargaris verticillata TaxID=2761393 RepID=A0A9W8E8B3_9FUNG|nr:actin-like protein arp8 [Dimargaris verticillata]